MLPWRDGGECNSLPPRGKVCKQTKPGSCKLTRALPGCAMRRCCLQAFLFSSLPLQKALRLASRAPKHALSKARPSACEKY